MTYDDIDRHLDAAGTFDRVREEEVRLEPGRVLVIDFEPGKGGILLR